MHVKYNTKGTCAVRIEFDVEGQKPEEVAKKLKGITCGRRTTSCPDQLALALEDFMKNQ